MHEVALTQSIVEAIQRRLGETRVVRVRIAVGQLTAVLPDALRFAFATCTEGTSLDGALLEIDEIAARGRCNRCAREGQLEGALALCPCGSADLELMSGRELDIAEVEVA